MNKLINQLSTAAAATPAPSVDFTSILQNTLLQSLSTVFANALQSTTQPTTTTTTTTVTNNNNNHDIVEKPSQPTKTNDTVPQYRPTPIAELERRKRVQQLPPPPPPVKLPVKSSDAPAFDSDDYVQATFSPPSNSPPPPFEEAKPKVVE